MFFRISVALLLSSQKPGLSESCFSSLILYRLFATSKKPPQDGNPIPHNPDLFLCHSREDSRNLLTGKKTRQARWRHAQQRAVSGLKTISRTRILIRKFKQCWKSYCSKPTGVLLTTAKSLVMKFFLALLLSATMLVSYKKEQVVPAGTDARNSTIEHARAASFGKIAFSGEENKCRIEKTYRTVGAYVLAPEKMNYKPLSI